MDGNNENLYALDAEQMGKHDVELIVPPPMTTSLSLAMTSRAPLIQRMPLTIPHSTTEIPAERIIKNIFLKMLFWSHSHLRLIHQGFHLRILEPYQHHDPSAERSNWVIEAETPRQDSSSQTTSSREGFSGVQETSAYTSSKRSSFFYF